MYNINSDFQPVIKYTAGLYRSLYLPVSEVSVLNFSPGFFISVPG